MRSELAVDIRKGVQFARQSLLPPVLRRIEGIEQLTENHAGVAAVRARVVVDQLKENILWLKNTGVVGEQAKQDADEELFKVMAGVTRILQRIVEFAHQLGGLDRDDRLIFETDTTPEHEVEGGDVLVQILEVKFQFSAAVEIEQPPILKVAGKHPARLVGRVQSLDIRERLPLRLAKIEATAFLFDQ